MDSDYGLLQQLIARGSFSPTQRTMPGILAATPVGGGADTADSTLARRVASPALKINPLSFYQQPQQQNGDQQQQGSY